LIRGQQVLPLGSPKQRALLGLFLVHANEAMPRERLIEELWGDAPPKTVKAVLNVYLSRLRRLLADGAGEQLLLTHAAGYVLRVRPEGLDARRFETLLERGRRELASGDAERASATLHDALALWRGPPLADLAFEPFAQSEIARLEELRLTAIEARIEADLALGRHGLLVAELENLVAACPYREGLRAQLMLALYQSGRQAEALETYRRTRRAFSEELGIEPGPRLHELERAILRHDPSLEAPSPEAMRSREAESIETVPQRSRFLSRRTVSLAAAFLLAIVAALVAAARYSSGGSLEPFVLAGDSVAVIDPGTDTIVGEIPVGDRPTGPAVGEGSVWVGNRDDNTLLRIDPKSLDVRTIGLGLEPIDVEVGAGSVWVLSDQALLRVDPAINDVVATAPLPPAIGAGRWSHLEVGANAVFVCSCGSPGGVVRVDPATTSVVTVQKGPIWGTAYGEGALWAITGWEQNTIERIDPETNAVESIPLGRLGETSGWRYRMAVAEGTTWLLAPGSLWRVDSTTGRFLGSVPLPHSEGGSIATGDGAVWIANSEGVVLRIDADSQAVPKTIPLGTLVYPAESGDALAVGEGSVWVSVTSFAS
jgi:DNA-binding SARP family transcriptional activator/DNA-binding beta-propeller fold protein YncE